jgi:hypothetical protein
MPNNGMHPTPHHAASHARRMGARVMPSVRRASDKREKDGAYVAHAEVARLKR